MIKRGNSFSFKIVGVVVLLFGPPFWMLINAEAGLPSASEDFQWESLSPWGKDTTVTVHVWVAADEEYRDYMGSWGDGWRIETFAAIEKADDAFYRDFGIDLVVEGYSMWDSNDYERDGRRLLVEAHDEVDWETKKGELDILLAFTGQEIDDHAGWAEHYMGSPDADTVLLQHQFDFGKGSKDWHVLQMEISHLFGAADHSDARDPNYEVMGIMSYKWVYSTDKWDEHCSKIIMENRERFE